MAVLKRVKASTLMETLVATVLIVVIFMISSMLLNNLFSNTLKGSDRQMEEGLNQLIYAYGHGKLGLPYYEEMGDCVFSVTVINQNGTETIRFEVTDQLSQKTIGKSIIYAN
ncbi:hypothetical protein [Ulvibacterium sp.]|uniref:hypothetical protein n=1 Tax=Ulvibacterium sp. TaxID=2665914 RepID=UPI002636E8E9|nr:hypothetical protein [Ulvibacterium sp.]